MEVDRTGLEQGWEVTHPFTPTLKCLLKATTEGAAGKKKYHPPLSRPSSPAQDTFSGTNRKKLTGRDIGLFFVFFLLYKVYLEKEMATHTRMHAWKFSWTGSLVGL